MKPDSEPTPGKEGESEQGQMPKEQSGESPEALIRSLMSAAEERRLAGLREFFRDVLGEELEDDDRDAGNQQETDDPLWDEEWQALGEFSDRMDEAEARHLAEGGEDADYCCSEEEMRIHNEFWNSPIGKRLHERSVKAGSYEKMHAFTQKLMEEMDRRRASKPDGKLSDEDWREMKEEAKSWSREVGEAVDRRRANQAKKEDEG